MSVSFSIGFLICPPVPFVIAVIGGCLNVWIFSPFSSAPVGCVLVVSGLSSGFGSLHTPGTAAGHSQLPDK